MCWQEKTYKFFAIFNKFYLDLSQSCAQESCQDSFQALLAYIGQYVKYILLPLHEASYIPLGKRMSLLHNHYHV
jgi:hypothetical protein